MLDSLIEYVSRYDSEFATRIVGFHPRRVEAFETMIGVCLPPAYRQYLLTMAKDTGGLPLFFEASPNLETLIDTYRRLAEYGIGRLPEGHILVASGGLGPEQFLLQIAGDHPGALFAFSGTEVYGRYADSLESLLYTKAFAVFRARAFATKQLYRAGDLRPRLAAVRELSRLCGFQLEPYSDSLAICATRDDCLLLARQFKNEPCWLQLYFNEQAAIDSFLNCLLAAFH